MTTLRILSAGAAQAVTERIIDGFKRETGNDAVADFGAVGAMKARFISGERVDVIILTRAMIGELSSSGLDFLRDSQVLPRASFLSKPATSWSNITGR